MPDKTSTTVMALPSGKAAGVWLHSMVSSLISYPSLAKSSGLAAEKWRGEKPRVRNADPPLHVCLSYHTAAPRLLHEGVALVPTQQAACPGTRAFDPAGLMASQSKRQWM